MGISQAFDKGSKSPKPVAPDFTSAAIATANASKYGVNGPYGSSTWTARPGADPANPQPGDWIQTTTLNPNEQGLYTSGVQNRQGVADATGAMVGDLGDRKTVADALYARSTRYMDQNFGDQKASLETQLQNQGLTQGSEAYDRALRNFDQTRNQAYGDAANSAVINADTAQNNAVQRIAQLLAAGRETVPTAAGIGGGPNLLGAAQTGYGSQLDQYNAGQAGKDAGIGNMLQLVKIGASLYGKS